MTADPQDERLSEQLDRLEALLGQREAELRVLRGELDLRQLYISELHGRLESQLRQLQDLDQRLRALESAPAPHFPSHLAAPGR